MRINSTIAYFKWPVSPMHFCGFRARFFSRSCSWLFIQFNLVRRVRWLWKVPNCTFKCHTRFDEYCARSKEESMLRLFCSIVFSGCRENFWLLKAHSRISSISLDGFVLFEFVCHQFTISGLVLAASARNTKSMRQYQIGSFGYLYYVQKVFSILLNACNYNDLCNGSEKKELKRSTRRIMQKWFALAKKAIQTQDQCCVVFCFVL